MKKKASIFLIVTILWIGFIYYNSCNNGSISQGRSIYIVNSIKEKYNDLNIGKKQAVEALVNNNSKNIENLPSNKRLSKTQQLNYFVRKNAHAFEYLVLAIFIAFTIAYVKIQGKNVVIYSLFICLLCAVLDEFNQSFVVERTSSVGDILIDFSGSCIGIIIFSIVKKLRR